MQIKDLTGVADTAIRQGANYDGGVYLAILVVLTVASIALLYVWFVTIPGAKATRDNSEKLAEATASLARATSETYKMSTTTLESVKDLQQTSGRLMNCTDAAIRAIEKIAKAQQVDVAMELGEMRGALK